MDSPDLLASKSPLMNILKLILGLLVHSWQRYGDFISLFLGCIVTVALVGWKCSSVGTVFALNA